jgi:hypothetical protein
MFALLAETHVFLRICYHTNVTPYKLEYYGETVFLDADLSRNKADS